MNAVRWFQLVVRVEFGRLPVVHLFKICYVFLRARDHYNALSAVSSAVICINSSVACVCVYFVLHRSVLHLTVHWQLYQCGHAHHYIWYPASGGKKYVQTLLDISPCFISCTASSESTLFWLCYYICQIVVQRLQCTKYKQAVCRLIPTKLYPNTFGRAGVWEACLD